MKLLKCPTCFNRPILIFDNGWHGSRSYKCCGLKTDFGSDGRYERIKKWNAAVESYKKLR